MNVLIVGKNSYIGVHAKKHLERFGHVVQEVDAVGADWKQVDYTAYDTVIHVAAIVHEDAKTASWELFHKVNTELPFEIAVLAKNAGVKQFVFLSTMAVYGIDKTLSSDTATITDSTPLKPVSLYGKSKLEAEKRLSTLADDTFKVAFVRPPNVYGPACKGNYMQLFQKLAKRMALCPCAFEDVRQSMLYIDNLSELLRLVIDNTAQGVFLPQDDCIPNTVELITSIRKVYGKKTARAKLLGSVLKLFKRVSIVNKLYGGVCYAQELSACFGYRYRVVTFEEGIVRTYPQ